jgi:GAF domain-containing protein
MRIYTREPREFSHEDIEFVEAIASLGAIALENAKCHAAVRTDLASLEAYVYRYPGN